MVDILSFVPERKIISWYQHIHANPELSFKEFETTNYIESILSTYDNLTFERLTETGVVATLTGQYPGKTIALRADIDALPIDEESVVTFPSKKKGVMHACGHDAHTSMLLGALDVLTTMTDIIHGKIKFIFQAAEEVLPGGAKSLVEKGVMEDVDMVFGLHVCPMLPVSSFAIDTGYVTATSDTFILVIKGKGAHGSMPNLAIDPIMIGTEIISNFNNLVSRYVDPFEQAVLSIGQFQAGTAPNVIPDIATIKGTVRTKRPDVKELIKNKMKNIIQAVCHMYGATYDLDYTDGYSAINNHPETTEIVTNSLNKLVEKGHIIPVPPMMGGEDFSAYTDVRPGTFFLLGSGIAEEGYGYINHHPKFMIDQRCLRFGSAAHIQVALDALSES